MKYLYGKTVIVTGGSSGIGLSLSTRLINKYGCTVIAVGRSEEKLATAKKNLGEQYLTFSCDVSTLEGWESLKIYIIENQLSPNLLINNAGIMFSFKKAEATNIEQFDKIISTDLLSVIYSMQTVVPMLSGDKGVVNISSSSALCPVVGQSGYCLSKSAVKSFTEVLQTEVKYYVGLMMPGFCKTDIMRSIDISKKDKNLIDKISITSDKCAKIILKAINKKRPRKIIGLDAKFMNFLYKLAPKKAGKIIAWFLRKSKLKMFDEIQY